MRALALSLALLAFGAAPTAARTFRPPIKPPPTALLAGPAITPDGLLIWDGERLRTNELDDLAPLRLRWTIRF